MADPDLSHGVTELHCDTCDKVIAYVQESDLNGSTFWCPECAKGAPIYHMVQNPNDRWHYDWKIKGKVGEE